jgi:hypothetical protein
MLAPVVTPVYLEVGTRRAFACALEWPGWCRSGKGEEAAVETLTAYRPRYAVVVAEAGLRFDPGELVVLERLAGSSTTDFGAPDAVPAADRRELEPGEGDRLAALVAAGWRVLDRVAAGAPAELRKGPRGGGRDRDAVVEHVVAAEQSYARKIGVRHRRPRPGDGEALAALRSDILAALRGGVDAGWPTRYAARRVAWHVLDHAWEIEDRSER